MTNPPIEADLNVANPSRVILELALVISEAAPFISAGVKIWSTDKLPCTVSCPSSNCKNCELALSPKRIALAVTLPSGVT